MPRKVPWSVPDISKDEKAAVNEVMESGWLGMGPKTKQFESELCLFTGSRNCIVVNNGTSALMAALLANGIEPGDEVLVPTYTFIATVNSVISIGAKPILVDCDPKTFNVSPEAILRALSGHSKAKAIIFVDVAGMPADIDAIRDIASKRGLVLIEDAAEAFGAKYKNKVIGSYDHTTIYSFHVAKQMTMVEGGAVVTDDAGIAEKIRLIRSHGEGKEKYIHVALGLNFRPTDIQSAIGIAQLRKVEKYISLRAKVASIYMSELAGLLEFQRIPDYVSLHPWMLFMCLGKNQADRDALNKFLNTNGVDTRIPWPPAHVQPYHSHKLAFGELPNATFLYQRVLSLPIGNAISMDDVEYVVQIVKNHYKR